MSKPLLLIVENIRNTALEVQELFAARFDVRCSATWEQTLASLSPAPDVILLDLRLDDKETTSSEGLARLRQLRSELPHTAIIVYTAFADTETTVACMRSGADDVVDKGDWRLVTARVENAVTLARDRFKKAEVESELELFNPSDIVGNSPGIIQVRELAVAFGQSLLTVLIVGETGTGKELVARMIHRSGPRPGPFVVANIAAYSKEIVESELFGHEKGAFTGATERRIGLFERANGGSIFLDEVGEVPMAVQVKLLRVVQEREFTRVGGNSVIRINVQLISATHCDLKQMFKTGEFREDLFYRINVHEIRVPPLRERKEDIPLLIEHFLAKLRRLGRPRLEFSQEAITALMQFHWPGNVRQLENTVESGLISAHIAQASRIELVHFKDRISETSRHAQTSGPSSIRETRSRAELDQIERALEAADGNVQYANEVLKASHRHFLSRRIQRIAVEFPEILTDFPRSRRVHDGRRAPSSRNVPE